MARPEDVSVVDDFRSVTSTGLTIFYIKVGYLWEDDYQFEKALRLLPFSQQTRIIAKKFVDDQKTALANQLLQRFVCSLLVNTDANSLVFTSNRYGKPQIQGSDVHFSMSNQRGFTSMVIASTECGIDLASPSDVAGVDHLVHFKDIFHDDEYDYLMTVEDSTSVFTHYWALKESFTKKLGVGLNGDLQAYNFRDVRSLEHDGHLVHQGVFKVRDPKWDSSPKLSVHGEEQPLQIWSTMLTPDVVISTCHAGHQTPQLVEVDLETIVKFLE